MMPCHQLKVLLLKEQVEDFEAAIRPDAEATTHPLKPGHDGVFLLKKTFPKTPSWVGFVEPGLLEPLGALRTQTAGGLLLIRAEDRIFAFTFGYGRSLLDPECYERDFGLRVVLNSVDAEQVRSVDMRTMEEMTVVTRRQASRAADFATFGLNSSQDLLRGVTGIPRDPEFASRIAGAEALTFAAAVEFDNLPAKCADLLEAYTSDRYKERFGFIDFLRLERDPGTIAELHSRLVADLDATDVSRMHLAPPEPEDWENVQGFTYSSSPSASVYLDLDINDALGEMNPRSGFSVEYLRRKSVGVRYREAEESVEKYTVFSCLVYETELNDRLYVLSGGDWHQVNKEWADGIRDHVAELPAAVLELPDSALGELEAAYNARAADLNGWGLMDQRIISLAPPYDRIEMCDLITPERQLVHVKRKTESATLSHLFAQGAVSAELLFRSREFREKCREKARAIDPTWEQMIPLERPTPSDYEIVYAILARSRADWPRSLPFFSQLNLANTASRLTSWGYRVSLRHVPADA